MERLRVLVIDDEEGMCRAIERALRRYSFIVNEIDEEISFDISLAHTGTDGLAAIEAEKPHLVLLDYKLPDMLGSDILERMQLNKDSDVLVIMITAFATIETAVVTIKRGAYDFLAKPFTPDELKSVVQKAATRLILQQQAQRYLEEKRQIRFQFISVLAHELKSPLNAIDGYLQIIHDKTLGDEVESYSKMVERCVIRIEGMRKLIRDLLDLTRIESGQKIRTLERLTLREIAVESMENMMAEAAERDISLNLLCDADVEITGDRDEFVIIFNNLISNAVKYNKDGGSVDILIKRTDDTIYVTVKDTGIGMSDEDAGRIFNDFVRIKNSATKNIQGSGLGLSIVKKLVTLYGGDIGVESTPDIGTTFTITLKEQTEIDQDKMIEGNIA
ncbi:MAG: response regulator [Deltaproteobacteria bacterium]|nr:response regulator [Candidatus Zymogenaceae bacterium]